MIRVKRDKVKELFDLLQDWDDYIPLRILALGGDGYEDRISDEVKERIFTTRNNQPSYNEEYFDNDIIEWCKQYPQFSEYFERVERK